MIVLFIIFMTINSLIIMKRYRIFKTLPLVLVCTLVFFAQCRSKSQLPEGDGYSLFFCSGPEYHTDAVFFRANSSADSPNMANSKRMALTNARSELAGQMEVMVTSVINNYFKDSGAGDQKELQQRYVEMSREAINQKLTGTAIICEKTTRTDEGRYRTFVAVELLGDELLDLLNEHIGRDDRLSLDYDHDLFKNTFNEGMRSFKMGQ